MKELTHPQRLFLTEILKERLTLGHPKYLEIEKDLAKRRAGYWGEMGLANYMKELPQEKYLIFHDLQLQINGIHFQMDTLLISQNYILIIEAKNISGTLVFDNVFKQLIRIHENGNEEAFEDPRVQCQRLQSLLRNWTAKNSRNVLPIDYLIFFKSTNTILKTNPGERLDFSKVCKGRDVFNKIENLEQRYNHERVDNHIIIKIGDLLLSHHSPKPINILNEYNLTEKDIRSGVCCPNDKCHHIPINYKRGKWTCPICQTISKEAHIKALSDYFYLIKPMITNFEVQSFLHLPNNDITQKILLRLKLPTSGKTKNRIYHLCTKKVSACVLS
ncbi:nuclease-related domain-containing protein [Neobacillus sp. WH10]|uniref:nuclease-related domain-containing protein n=1 Tax=Neobacillus sp. WH10 TaxID=3047873 RepID=UPI0024C12983|nr:nuclease-related domain-containing protein [Neobacillus sp. WH10]WHY80204.1 nuclease-related domain-containing protein [Neobacillus sp. WH10]